MKRVFASIGVGLSVFGLLVFGLPLSLRAQDVPPFIQETYPAQAVDAAVAERKLVMLDGALDSRTKHLIALGVAAQIPCRYCVYFHTAAAKHAGATEAQIKEAIAAAALVRKWSTVLNGSAYDFDKLKRQVDAAFANH